MGTPGTAILIFQGKRALRGDGKGKARNGYGECFDCNCIAFKLAESDPNCSGDKVIVDWSRFVRFRIGTPLCGRWRVQKKSWSYKPEEPEPEPDNSYYYTVLEGCTDPNGRLTRMRGGAPWDGLVSVNSFVSPISGFVYCERARLQIGCPERFGFPVEDVHILWPDNDVTPNYSCGSG